jgi:transcriptional regulator with XRE-family HTH domain
MSPDKRDRSPPREDHRKLNALVGGRMKSRREYLGLTRGELAAALGVNEGELAAIEDGAARAGPKLLGEASRALAVPVHWFFAKEGA